MDQSTAREEFANQAALIIRDLQEMLEKTKQIEAFLTQEINPRLSTVDFYRPADETQNFQPPRKRIKLSIS
jgi:cell division protein ZapA (FtsZ GTPase activity inhibitor)